MREIKFRLILKEKIVGYEKWYEGKFSKIDGQTANPCWLYSKDNKYWNPDFIWHKQKNQYTGLKDKNGKEIYEGDILLRKNDGGFEYKYDISWSDGGFIFGAEDVLNKENIKEYKLEVIGNIYENKDLLHNNDAHTAS